MPATTCTVMSHWFNVVVVSHSTTTTKRYMPATTCTVVSHWFNVVVSHSTTTTKRYMPATTCTVISHWFNVVVSHVISSFLDKWWYVVTVGSCVMQWAARCTGTVRSVNKLNWQRHCYYRSLMKRYVSCSIELTETLLLQVTNEEICVLLNWTDRLL